MASGRFEINEYGDAAIVELPENCVRSCSPEYINGNNVTAVWSVEKIRHRDANRGHRFEMKISVKPIKNIRYDNRRDANINQIKSRNFLIKDNDYPKYFVEPPNKQRMEKRVFNMFYDNTEIPFNLNYGRRPMPIRPMPNLNTGEFFMGPSMAPLHGRPMRYPEPQQLPIQSQYPPRQPNLFDGFSPVPLQKVPPANLHHHYFLNKDEAPIFKATLFEEPKLYSPQPPPMHSTMPSIFQNQRPNLLPFGGIQYPIRFPGLENQPRPTPNHIHPNEHFNGFNQFKAPIQVNYPIPANQIDFSKTAFGEIDPKKIYEINNNVLSTPKPFTNNRIPSQINSPQFVYQLNPTQGPSPIPFFANDANPIQYSPQFSHASQPNVDQLYWLNPSNVQSFPRNNGNFQASFPLTESTFSELDPIYHNRQEPAVIVTPINVIPLNNNEADGQQIRSTLQSPTQNPGTSLAPLTENTPSTQIDATYSTPYDTIPTTIRNSDFKTDRKRERNRSNYPDSINAQLPPPDSDDDLRVPYVDETARANKPLYDQVTLIESSDEQNAANSKSDYVTTVANQQNVKINENHRNGDSRQRNVVQNRFKTRKTSFDTTAMPTTTSTEKPASKWQPKRVRQRKPTLNRNAASHENYQRPRKSTTTTTISNEFDAERKKMSDIITEMSMIFHDEPRTSQSIKKSVSVRVGDEIITESPSTIHTTVWSSANVTRMASIKPVNSSSLTTTSTVATTSEDTSLLQ